MSKTSTLLGLVVAELSLLKSVQTWGKLNFVEKCPNGGGDMIRLLDMQGHGVGVACQKRTMRNISGNGVVLRRTYHVQVLIFVDTELSTNACKDLMDEISEAVEEKLANFTPTGFLNPGTIAGSEVTEFQPGFCLWCVTAEFEE